MNYFKNLQSSFTESSIQTVNGTNAKVFGGISNGAKPRPFSVDRSVRSFGSWVYIAAMLNAQAFASVPLRLYVRKKAGVQRLYNTRTVKNRNTKRYLFGDAKERPSRAVMQKIVDFGSEFEEVTEKHPVLDVLSTVNPWQNGFELSVLRMLYLQITGNSYMAVAIDPALNRPSELVLLPSQYTRVVPDPERFIGAFKYGRAPSEIEIDASSVLRWARPNLSDPYYGMGCVEAVWSAIGVSESKRIMDKALFDNQARPDWLLLVKDGASEDTLNRLESQVNEKLMGPTNGGKFLVGTGDIEAVKLNFAPDELGDQNRVIEEIAGGFGVPISKLLANDPNRANAETGDAGWLRDTILPYLRMDEETLNATYLPMFGLGDDAVLAYDNPVPQNQDMEIKRLTSYVSGNIIEPNEARAELGYDAAEWGDQPLAMLTKPSDPFASLLQSTDQKPTEEPATTEQQVATVPTIDTQATLMIISAYMAGKLDREPAKTMLGKIGYSQSECDSMLQKKSDGKQVINGTTDGKARPLPDGYKLIPILRSFFRKQCAEILSSLKGKSIKDIESQYVKSVTDAGGEILKQDGFTESEDGSKFIKWRQPTPDEIHAFKRAAARRKDETPKDGDKKPPKLPKRFVPLDEWNEKMAAEVQPVLEVIAKEQGKRILQRIGASPDVFSVFEKNIPKAIEEASMKFCQATNEATSMELDTALSNLRDELSAGMVEGEGIPELTDRVQAVFDNAEEFRAERIARTEAARASHTGEMMGAKESGVVSRKSWLASADCCDKCEALGMLDPIPLDKTFAELGGDYGSIDGPPLHPNCIIDPDTRVIAPDLLRTYKARYKGPAVEIMFANGNNLTVTVNHMLLTSNGFVRAGNLRKGDNVLNCVDGDWAFGSVPNDNRKPSTIGEVISAAAKSSGMFACSVPSASKYLHGDGMFIDGNIDIESSDGFLSGDRKSIGSQLIGKPDFSGADIGLPNLSGSSDFASMLFALRDATDGGMSTRGTHLPLIGSQAVKALPDEIMASANSYTIGLQDSVQSAPAYSQLLANGNFGVSGSVQSDGFITVDIDHPQLSLSSELNTAVADYPHDRSLADSKRLADVLKSFAGKVAELDIVDVRFFEFDGHVYDLQTGSSLYAANGVLNSNCVCSLTYEIND